MLQGERRDGVGKGEVFEENAKVLARGGGGYHQDDKQPDLLSSHDLLLMVMVDSSMVCRSLSICWLGVEIAISCSFSAIICLLIFSLYISMYNKQYWRITTRNNDHYFPSRSPKIPPLPFLLILPLRSRHSPTNFSRTACPCPKTSTGTNGTP